jgi:hypothetical protein
VCDQIPWIESAIEDLPFKIHVAIHSATVSDSTPIHNGYCNLFLINNNTIANMAIINEEASQNALK